MPVRTYHEKEPFPFKRLLIPLAVAVVLLLIGGGLYVFTRGDEDTRAIKRLIYAGAEAIENRDPDACLALLHDSYTDNMGHTYEDVSEWAGQEFNDIKDISIKIRRLDIEVERGVGTARFDIRFRAKVSDHMGRTIPVSGITTMQQPFGPSWESAALRCIKRGDTWLITELSLTAEP